MSYGISSDYNSRLAYANASALAKYHAKYDNASTSSATNSISSTTTNTDTLSLSRTTGCTDGDDDGKIGLFSAIGNTAIGVLKGVANMAVGAFTKTDENGNRHFSLGKTLLTIGATAACIAFPAVGLGLCAVGAVTGGIQVAKGVVNAAKADTDEEKKSAFQNIGSGGLQVAASVVGAKASLKAVKTSSTAGLKTYAEKTQGMSADDVANLSIDEITGLKSTAIEKNTTLSALDNLGEDATFIDKVGALGKDLSSSTKNNYTIAKETLTLFKGQTKVAKAKKAYDSAIEKGETNVSELDKVYTDAVKEQAELLENTSKSSVKTYLDSLETKQSIKNNFSAKLSKVKAKFKKSATSETATAETASAATAENAAADSVATKTTLISRIKNVFKTKKSATSETATVETASAATAENAATSNTSNTFLKFTKLRGKNFSSIKGRLSETGAKILSDITDGNKSYNKLVSDYGYSNVKEVLEILAELDLLDSTV